MRSLKWKGLADTGGVAPGFKLRVITANEIKSVHIKEREREREEKEGN